MPDCGGRSRGWAYVSLPCSSSLLFAHRNRRKKISRRAGEYGEQGILMNTTFSARGRSAFALTALPLAVASHSVFAQSETSDDAEDAQTLNPLVVTAALAPRTADQSLSSVTVLDEATLRRQDPTSLSDLFRGQPGVDVNSNGSFGKTSSVCVRGTSSYQGLLMIDGIRLRSATLGRASWQFLDPRMFERAEIVRGPRGSLYGADAMGGVIQLFTPEGEEGEPTPRISF